MKKLLLISTALIALSVPAKADFVSTLSSPSIGPDNGKEDVFMFLDNSPKGGTNTFTGSTTGNGSHTTDSVNINTMGFVDTSSGFATIKPIKDGTLTDLVFTPNTAPPTGQGPFLFDGFFIRGQLEWTNPDPMCKVNCAVAPNGTTVYIDVNGGASKGGASFSYFEGLPEQNDFAAIGFDEPLNADGTDNETKASLITLVHMWVSDENISFSEVKQSQWSVCNSDTTGCVSAGTHSVPGPLAGAGLPGLVTACLTLLGLVRHRRKQSAA